MKKHKFRIKLKLNITGNIFCASEFETRPFIWAYLLYSCYFRRVQDYGLLMLLTEDRPYSLNNLMKVGKLIIYYTTTNLETVTFVFVLDTWSMLFCDMQKFKF